MVCLCKNSDGTLSSSCNGTCTQKELKQINYVTQLVDKSIIDKIECILYDFLRKLDSRIDDLEEECHVKYREGFRQGFEMSREIYEQLHL